MNEANIATLAVVPDLLGWGMINVLGLQRRCYFDRRVLSLPKTPGRSLMVRKGHGDTYVALWWVN